MAHSLSLQPSCSARCRIIRFSRVALIPLFERRYFNTGVLQRLAHTAGDIDCARRIAVDAYGIGAHLDNLARD